VINKMADRSTRLHKGKGFGGRGANNAVSETDMLEG
jgi:hypothetical protein